MAKAKKVTPVPAETTASDDTDVQPDPIETEDVTEEAPEPEVAPEVEEVPAEPAPPEEAEDEAPASRKYSGAKAVCTVLEGAIQIHLLKPDHEQNPDAPTPAITSTVLVLGDMVNIEDLLPEVAETVQQGGEKFLRYAADEGEAQQIIHETRSRLTELTVAPDRVYNSAEK
jgi:hypothetical protein